MSQKKLNLHGAWLLAVLIAASAGCSGLDGNPLRPRSASANGAAIAVDAGTGSGIYYEHGPDPGYAISDLGKAREVRFDVGAIHGKSDVCSIKCVGATVVCADDCSAIQLDNVRSVSFAGADISSRTLDMILDNQSIEIVNLSCTPFGDEAVDMLVGMPKLRIVYLDSTNVSANGIRRLVRGTPSLEVVYFRSRLSSECAAPEVADEAGCRIEVNPDRYGSHLF